MVEIAGSGNSFNYTEINTNESILRRYGLPAWPASGGTGGGFFSVTGMLSAATAVSLAANTTLMSMRLSSGSLRKAYITSFIVNIACCTQGISGLVPGTLGLQRFNTATPTTGNARVVNRFSEVSGSTSDVTDVRDLNSALSVTSVVFGNVVASSNVPLFIASGACSYDWVVEPPCPIILAPGDGLCLRTQVAMPATQTWLFSYTVNWFEQ